VKESKQISLSPSDSTAPRDGFQILDARQSDFDHVLGRGLDPQRARPNTPENRVLASGFGQDADGLGGEVKWDGENAEVIAPF
jgi:hypothetical protein